MLTKTKIEYTGTPKEKIQQRANAALMGRLYATLKTWNKAEARRNKRAGERTTTHPKWRRHANESMLQFRFNVMANSPGGALSSVGLNLEAEGIRDGITAPETLQDIRPSVSVIPEGGHPVDPSTVETPEDWTPTIPEAAPVVISPSDALSDAPEKDPA